MKAPWNPQSGFQVLKVWFMYTITFAAFASQIIPPTDVLNMLIAVILATGVFHLEYTKWHIVPAGERIVLAIWDWWAKKVLLRLKVSKVAGNMNHGMEYGMNTSDTAHKELGVIIKDFAQGHMATQNTIQNLTQTFPKLCAQMQQHSMMIQ